MTTARPVRPTDFVALVSFDGRVYPNEAHCWERLGCDGGANLLESALEQWLSFATGRHTWISVKGQTIQGVISARQRGSRLAWEVDCLIVAAEEIDAVLSALLDRLTTAGVQAGTLRLFIRVEEGSDVQEGARQHGFVPYCRETLYRLDSPAIGSSHAASDISIRPRSRGDGFALFRLYNDVTPTSVRSLEAATYAEWIAAQERRSQGRGRLDAVAEVGGEVVAWIRAVPDGNKGRLDLLVSSSARNHMAALLDHALVSLGSRQPVFCLVPSYVGGLAALLGDRGFTRDREYSGLVKRLVVPIKQAVPARVVAHQPIAMLTS